MGFIGFYRGFTGFYRICYLVWFGFPQLLLNLQGRIGLYWVLLGLIQFRSVWLNFYPFYWVLLGCTEPSDGPKK